MVQHGATWCNVVQHGATWCNFVQHGATWCKVVQDGTDVPGPQIKINVGQLEAQKRKEIVDVATQMAEQWSKEDKKEVAREKSDEALGNLINGNCQLCNKFTK